MWGFNLLPHWYSPRHKQYIQCSLCLPSLSLLQKLVLAFPPTIQMSKGKPFCDCNTMNSFGSNSLTGLFIHTSLYSDSQIEKGILDLSCSSTYVYTSLGTNSSMFANCSVFCDVLHVRSSVLGQNVMFGSVRRPVLLNM